MTTHTPVIAPVILCGGTGTRLWPLSRESYPKQFLQIGGEATMLQQTALRLKGLSRSIKILPDPIIVCNAEHRFIAAEQMHAVGLTKAQIILEPYGRNTAPALTLAALLAMELSEDPILLAMPADHVVADEAAFHTAVQTACIHAQRGAMVTFGVVANRPEIGYGYIQRDAVINDGAYSILKFAEKPDADTAARYIESGDYLWNSGIFMIQASLWLDALNVCRPDIMQKCKDSMLSAVRDLDFIRPDSSAFFSCPSDSIDYAVMERLPSGICNSTSARVVPLLAGWSDVGAWDAVWDISQKDSHGNAVIGNAILQDCTDSLVVTGNSFVAGVGLHGLVVVETADAILVAEMTQTQKVKELVTELKSKSVVIASKHRKMMRPWGWYDSIDTGKRFQVKRIVVNPGATLSLQMHHHRAEHWIVVSGTAEVTSGDDVFLLTENQSTYIPLGHKHRLANPGKVPLEMIEVQSGSYLGEDDIVRYQDSYGRVEAVENDKLVKQ
jgi:mannose-1-phosphate guanylyltransferase/mannose-6-phosphate isomerase